MRLGTASVTIQADGLRKYDSDLNKAEKRTDKFGRKSSKSVNKTTSAIKTLGLTAGSVLGAAVLGKAVKDSIAVFKNFETATIDMGKVTSRNLNLIKTEILDLDSALGTSTDLMKGYYQVISAGVTDPIKSIDLLTISAQASKAAHLEQSETIKALTKVMAGFEGQLESASEAADLLFSIEKAGQTSFRELVPVVGSLAKITSEVGGTIDDLAAGFAVLTQTVGSTAEAATQWESLMVSLYKPTLNMKTLLDDLGFSTGQEALEELGFIETIKQIKQYADSAGTSLGSFIERKEALMAISALATDNFSKFNDTLLITQDRVGSADKAYQEWLTTMDASFDELTANLEKLKISFVDAFGDDTKSLIDSLAESVGLLSDGIGGDEKGVATGLAKWWTGIPQLKLFSELVKSIAKDTVQAGKNINEVLNGIDYRSALNDISKTDGTMKELNDTFEVTVDTVGKFIPKAFEEAKKSIDNYNKSIKSSAEIDYASIFKNTPEEIVKQTREMADGYEYWGNIVNETNEEVKDSSQDTFQSMADFYKDALLQMVDGTGSFADMIKGKLMNLGATIASSVLTSVTGSVLSSIPGVGGGGGILSSIPGLGNIFGGGVSGGEGFTPAGVFSGISKFIPKNLTSGLTGGLGGMLGLAGVGYSGFNMIKESLSDQGPSDTSLFTAGISPLAPFVWGSKIASIKRKEDKLKRQHRADRYSKLLQRMSVGTGKDPFDISDFDSQLDLLDTEYGKRGIWQFARPERVYALGKYGGARGPDSHSQLLDAGKSLNAYKNIIKDFGPASREAIEASNAFSESIDAMAAGMDDWTKAGQSTIQMFQQLDTNLQQLKFQDLLSFLATDEISASASELLFARDALFDTADALDEASRKAASYENKLIVLNSSLELTGKQLANLRKESSVISFDVLNALAGMGITDRRVDIGAGITTTYEEWNRLNDDTMEAIVERYNLERSQIESIKGALTNLSEGISGNLLALTTGTSNPADIQERLAILGQEAIERSINFGIAQRGQFQAQTGTNYAAALNAYLSLAQEAFQRPSVEYQQIFEFVTSELARIQDVADEEIKNTDNLIKDQTKQTVNQLRTINDKLDDVVDAILNTNSQDNIVSTVDYSIQNGDLRNTVQDVANS